MKFHSFQLLLFLFCLLFIRDTFSDQGSNLPNTIEFKEFSRIPDALGVAGPYAGICNGYLVVAGGANFPEPIWESKKIWHDDIYALDLETSNTDWKRIGALPKPLGYGASVSTEYGIICLGGNDANQVYSTCFILNVTRGNDNNPQLQIMDLPSMPSPTAYSQAQLYANKIYMVGGQSDLGLESANSDFLHLDLNNIKIEDGKIVSMPKWTKLDDFPGAPRAFHTMVVQHDGFDDHLFIASGRTQGENEVVFLKDHWKFNLKTGGWEEVASAPQCFMAGPAVSHAQSHYIVLGGDTGENFFRADELKDNHPGFPKRAFSYNAITDIWSEQGPIPANHVTTVALKYKGDIYLTSGEVRPRVRSPIVWKVNISSQAQSFNPVNTIIIVIYLVLVVGVGVYFTKNNKNTDDYFTGGKRIAWWVAGCSVFATMLSSLTYTGLPSRAFSQDWTYAVLNLMIPVVAIFAVFYALPFFRSLKSASAYEFLEIRFDRNVRKVASGIFILFHLFRMAVVMSLTSLALAVASPLDPYQSVVLMGVLCIAYSVSGGIEAVVWTDTIQTVVLLLGAITACWYLLAGIDGGWDAFVTIAGDDNKFNYANLHWDASSSAVALWIIIIGSLGQNLSSYTSDQAVVQRYLTTPTKDDAARAIWLNAGLSIFATVLFFGIGTGLYVYFKSSPEALDLNMANDQIFPYFIISQMPVGLSGLIIAGIFAAAQSTVSTSMNSMATASLTDFTNLPTRDGKKALFSARILTLVYGVLGTLVAFAFVSPQIKSLFDEFIKIVGLFLGSLGGLFLLGMLTKRANAIGALGGVVVTFCILLFMFFETTFPAMLFPLVSVFGCFALGYLISLFVESESNVDFRAQSQTK